MFDNFLRHFRESIVVQSSPNAYEIFMTRLGGRSFGEGLFRSFSQEEIQLWTELITEAFPSFENQFKLFGYDWLGRCFGVDNRKGRQERVLLFEIGTNMVLEIPGSIEYFLDTEMIVHADACLAKSFFEEWLSCSKARLERGRCAGYKIPLFLGGKDVVENLEDSDMQVYWSILIQIKNQ